LRWLAAIFSSPIYFEQNRHSNYRNGRSEAPVLQSSSSQALIQLYTDISRSIRAVRQKRSIRQKRRINTAFWQWLHGIVPTSTDFDFRGPPLQSQAAVTQ
jgi:hypothetical protein